MKKIIYAISFVMMSLFAYNLQAQTLLFSEPFNYPVGDSLTAHNWVVHSTGVNTILTKSGSLTYPQYPASTGNKAYVQSTGQDINHTFAGVSSGVVYMSALVKVDSALASTTSGDYFLHFRTAAGTAAGRVYVRKSTTNSSMIGFGIGKGTTPVYTASTYSIDSTYLVVLRYKFVTGTTNDSVSIFINPAYNNEGTPTLKATDMTQTDLDSAYTVALRQGTNTNYTYVNVDEIRVSDSWNLAIAYLTAPQITTTTVSNITTDFAVCSGNVLANGGSPITARGICYDTIASPTLTNFFTTETAALGTFSSNLSGLISGKTYHYRAYATNAIGTTYGADSIFTTSAVAVSPFVTTAAATNLTYNSATLNGNILSDGGATVTARGFCYGLVANPTLTDSLIPLSGTTGSITASALGLLSNTTYHVRAFATNSVGTTYGSDVSLITRVFVPTYTIPQVHGEVAATLAADSLGVNCKLLGVVHGLNYIATGYSFYLMNSDAGIFVYKTTSLGYTITEGDSLRVIGKIAQVSGLTEIVPDSIVKISSGSILQTPFVANTLSDTTESRFVKMNNLTYVSGWPITAGTTATVNALSGTTAVTIIVYLTSNIQGTPAPTVSFNIAGFGSQLDANSPYTTGYRMYARYLSDLTFNLVVPTVTTTAASGISMTSAICGGNVTAAGGSTITQRGVCYGITANPDTAGTHVVVAGTTGVFSTPLSGLTSGTLYHFRPYAINTTGVAYGADSSFTTAASAVLPVVTTDSIYNISIFTASAAAKVVNDGGDTIITRGVCWSKIANPTILDSINTQSGTIGAFNSNLTNLQYSTVYYVRAFATNAIGTSYGNQLTFTTKLYIPTYTISQVHGEVATTLAADSLGVNCKLLGVVHGLNYIATGYSFYLMDNTAGINVYKTSTLGYTLTEGDSLRVIGKIAQLSGLTQIAPDSIVKISSGATLQNPTVITTLSDTTESKLIKMNNLTYVSNWPVTAGATATVNALSGTTAVTIIVYSTSNIQGTPAPTVSFNIVGIGSQLDANSPYTTGYRMYARYLSDVTFNYAAPTVLTTTATSISMSGAVCGGNVTATGGTAIAQRGICYGTTANPDTAGTHSVVTGTTGVFSATISGLTVGTLYHYRAYAINTTGVAYGADSSFTTAAGPVVPLVTTDSIFNIGIYTASAAATVVNDGGASVISRGVCWSTVALPTVLDSINTQTGTIGSFVSSLANLTYSTLYYVRAFAINSAGVSYGNQLTFTTKLFIPTYNIAQVHTENATTGVADSLAVNCKLTGVVHGINFISPATGTGLNFFIMDSTGGINVYKTTNLGYVVKQGDMVRIIGKTAQVNGLTEIVPDSLVLLSDSNALFNALTLNIPQEPSESKLIKIDSLRYLSGWPTTVFTTVRTVYSIKNLADTVIIRIYPGCNLMGTPAPTATVLFSIRGLENQADASNPYTATYQVLPRDTNDLIISFANPTVITGTATGVTQYTALCAGSIPTDGGHAITSRGICYSLVANPTTADSIRTATGTTGAYTANLTNLTLGTTYHYRAYGINSLGTFYGNDSVFTTSLTAVVPVLTTANATLITYTGASVAGTVINDGGDTVLTRGICWGTSHNPTIADSFSVAASTATFTSIIANLTDYTTYYARAYANNDIGYVYGNEITFKTLRLPPSYNISQVHTENATTGVADSLTVNCKLNGVVHSISFRQTATFTGYNFWMLDPTAGINVYRTTALAYVPAVGDSIRVIGKIAQVNGLTEIVPDSVVLLTSGNGLHTPIVEPSMFEIIESQLIQMDTLTYVSGWPVTAGNTINVLCLKGIDTVTVRLYTNCNLQGTPAPTDSFNLIGFVSQIDNTNPYTSGYVLVPRDTNDMIHIINIPDNVENAINSDNSFRLYPNPANKQVSIRLDRAMDSEIKIYSLIGNVLLRQESSQILNTIDVSGFARGIYFVNVLNKSNKKTYTQKLIIQ